MRTLHLRTAFTLTPFALAVALLVGCGDSQVRTGMSLSDAGYSRAAVGQVSPDFAFVGSDEVLTRFSTIRGRVTILAFPDSPDWPDCAACARLAKLADEMSEARIDVVTVSVGGPERPCREALPDVQQCQLPSQHLVAICDRQGGIRDLFGEHARGAYFVINNRGKIAAVGELRDHAQLHTDVLQTVAEISDAEYSPESEV